MWQYCEYEATIAFGACLVITFTELICITAKSVPVYLEHCHISCPAVLVFDIAMNYSPHGTPVDMNSLQPCWIFILPTGMNSFLLNLLPIPSVNHCCHVCAEPIMLSVGPQMTSPPTVSGFKPSESYTVIADQDWSTKHDGDNICEHIETGCHSSLLSVRSC